MSEERLQKVLARAGVASRRAAEELIVSGRVKVDGRTVRELGVRVDPRSSRVDVDGRRIVAEPLVYVILHKPRAVMCTLSDPEGRETIRELLRGAGSRLVPIGRLDYHTSGALLCTNDGDFAARLLHPRGGVPKEYVAKVRGVVDDQALARWRESIVIDGRATQPAEVRLLRVEGDKSWISLVLREGRNRQVRRLGEATGFPVLRLARSSHAGITTDGLRPGQWRHLSRDELVELKEKYGVPKQIHSVPGPNAAPARPLHRSTRGPARGKPAHGVRSRQNPDYPARSHTEPGSRAWQDAERGGRAQNAERGGRAQNTERGGRAQNAERGGRAQNAERGGRARSTPKATKPARRSRS